MKNENVSSLTLSAEHCTVLLTAIRKKEKGRRAKNQQFTAGAIYAYCISKKLLVPITEF